jgi:hypothetical protein
MMFWMTSYQHDAENFDEECEASIKNRAAESAPAGPVDMRLSKVRGMQNTMK